MQQTVQHALAAAAIGPAPEAQTSPPPQAPLAESSEGYCAIHQVWMEQRSNERGAWYSHIAADDEGEYFCRGKGRTRRNGR